VLRARATSREAGCWASLLSRAALLSHALAMRACGRSVACHSAGRRAAAVALLHCVVPVSAPWAPHCVLASSPGPSKPMRLPMCVHGSRCYTAALCGVVVVPRSRTPSPCSALGANRDMIDNCYHLRSRAVA
jgi:hypothetical protein